MDGLLAGGHSVLTPVAVENSQQLKKGAKMGFYSLSGVKPLLTFSVLSISPWKTHFSLVFGEDIQAVNVVLSLPAKRLLWVCIQTWGNRHALCTLGKR